MKKLILKIYGNDVIRYVFWGGLTTLVNLVSFYLMRLADVPLMTANVISIILAILLLCGEFQVCVSMIIARL